MAKETKTVNSMRLSNIITEYGYNKQVHFPNGGVIHADDKLCLQEDYEELYAEIQKLKDEIERLRHFWYFLFRNNLRQNEKER